MGGKRVLKTHLTLKKTKMKMNSECLIQICFIEKLHQLFLIHQKIKQRNWEITQVHLEILTLIKSSLNQERSVNFTSLKKVMYLVRFQIVIAPTTHQAIKSNKKSQNWKVPGQRKEKRRKVTTRLAIALILKRHMKTMILLSSRKTLLITSLSF